MWQGMTIKRDRQTVRHRHRNRKRPQAERDRQRDKDTHRERQEMEGESFSLYSGPQQTIIIKAQVSTRTRNI